MDDRANGPFVSESVTIDDELVFGPFRLLSKQRLLLEGETPIALGARAFDILVALAEQPGKVIDKDELIARVWPGVFIEEGNLRVHIAALRKALGDGQAGRRFIVTTPGRGYSLVGSVVRTTGKPAAIRPAMPPPTTDNLPSLLRGMVGRDETVALLTAQLLRCRFMTIIGPGGIGKTTVALSIAAGLRSAYSDGVWLVDLAPTIDPALMSSVLALVLGIPVSSRDPIPDLLTVLRGKRMLLVLDNCEHVIDIAATLAEGIFRNAPDVHILATSREALRVEGETVWRLPSLEAPSDPCGITAVGALVFPAVQLFVQRVSAMSAPFELLDADAPIVGEICRRLDGIPLAIELAAARVESFGVRGVRARLNDRFRLLTRGYRTALPRHQTLRATFDWSYELLGEPARVVLRRLALLAGDFTLSAASAVADGDDIDIEDQIATLVATSLVLATETEQVVRYRLLDSTRAYAHERLTESGEFAKFSHQHAKYFSSILQAAGQEMAVWPLARWLAIYGCQIDNVRTALDWAFAPGGDPELGVDLTIAAAPLLLLMSLNEECRSRVTAALAHLQPNELRAGRRAMQLWAELGAAHVYTLHRGPEVGTPWTKTLEIAEVLDAADYQLRALKGLWTSAFNAGDLASATLYSEKFSHVATTFADPAYAQLSGRMLAMTDLYTGRLEAARARAADALAGYTNVDVQLDLLRFQFDQRMILAVNLAKTLWLQGKSDQAVEMAQSSIEYAREADHELSITYALAYAVIRIAIQTGDFEAAQLSLGLLSRYASSNPKGQFSLLCRCWHGSLLCRQGDVVAGADLLQGALKDTPEHSFQMHYTRFLGEFAHATGVAGEVEEASKAIDRALALCDLNDERWYFAELLRLKGEIALMDGGPGAEAVADDCFRRSLDWSHRQGALSWELRAAMSLAKLNHARARTSEAHAGLAAVYGRFTEGFGTYDLMAAKRFLDSINQGDFIKTPCN